MPEAVSAFFTTHDLNEVARVQRRILSSIRNDFGRYRANGAFLVPSIGLSGLTAELKTPASNSALPRQAPPSP